MSKEEWTKLLENYLIRDMPKPFHELNGEPLPLFNASASWIEWEGLLE